MCYFYLKKKTTKAEKPSPVLSFEIWWHFSDYESSLISSKNQITFKLYKSQAHVQMFNIKFNKAVEKLEIPGLCYLLL